MSVQAIKDELRRIRWRYRSVVGAASFHRPTVRLATCVVGGTIGQGGWVVYPDGLGAASIVYAVGVGDDISFDLGMIERFATTIQAVDPTPASHRWLATQDLPPQFVLHKVGLADFDGTAMFAANDVAEWVSHSMVRVAGRELEELPVRRLSTLMAELGHDHIDVLKLDIEGAEYAVIDDLLGSRISVRQILVEFHHRFEEVGWPQTDRAIAMLRDAGYELFYVNGRGEEYGFVRV